MSDYHTVYKGPEGETTQWEDIHRRLGNLPPREPVWKPAKYTPQQDAEHDKQWVEKAGEEELEEAEDELADDRFLEEYRRKRLEEMQLAAIKKHFGAIEDIRGNEFVEKVTNASSDGWVVVYLYKEGNHACQILGPCIEEVARQFPNVKFVRIVSTDCIANYPDRNLPTLLLYHGKNCQHTLAGLHLFGGDKATPEQVALVLNSHGAIASAEEEDKVAEHQMKSLVQRVVRQREEEEDSDFDD